MSTATIDRRSSSVTQAEINAVQDVLYNTSRENSLSADAIAISTGFTARQVRRIIRAMNFRGFAIIGSPERGFWTTSSADELLKYGLALHDQATALAERSRRMIGMARSFTR